MPFLLILSPFKVIENLQVEEENKNIEENNRYLSSPDRNENLRRCERISDGDDAAEDNGDGAAEVEDKTGVRMLEQMPSTESESSGCSKIATEPALEHSPAAQESHISDNPGSSVAGEPMKVEVEKSEGRTSPDSPSSIYQVIPPFHNLNLITYLSQVKWVTWGKVKCPVITQNENGPCPLISIVNVLLLRGKLSLPEGCQVISAGQLLEWLADLLLDLREEDQAARPDFQHNINDAIAVLPKLQTGLDVNVRFTGVGDFEYTEDSLIFDLLDISLYHGWLVDPQTTEVAAAVANLSYNQLVETIISNRSSADSHAMSRALVAEQWLEDSRSQLTYHGLAELSTTLKEGELAVFFRNNHFSTVHRSGGQLFLLVTDQGFLEKSSLVWETLANIEGDTEFVDAQFQPGEEGLPQGEEGDRALALALGRQEEQGREREQVSFHRRCVVFISGCVVCQEWEEYKGQLGGSEELSDAQLAARLQVLMLRLLSLVHKRHLFNIS